MPYFYSYFLSAFSSFYLDKTFVSMYYISRTNVLFDKKGEGITERMVLHSDLNNFFASVECFLDPSLEGHPVAVAGNPEARHGIILAKNCEAKKYGVSTGEALWEARMKCPGIIFVAPHYEKYVEFAEKVRGIYAQYTDQVEPYGLDECWLDVTGSTRLFGNGVSVADEIRNRVHKEMGITVSVGVSFNKIFAKLGSDMKKPDATTVIARDSFREKIWPLPVGELLYIGRSSAAKLGRYGILTIGDLAEADETLLTSLMGKTGLMLRRFARGEDTSPVANIGQKNLIKSVSCGSTTPRDMTSDDDIKILLMALSTKVSSRLREYGFMCRTVQLQIRDSDLSSIVRQKKLTYPCRTSQEIYTAAYELFLKNHRVGTPVRSMSVHAADLDYRDFEQLSFDPDLYKIQRRENLECAFDEMNAKFGSGTLRRGLMMTSPELCGISIKNEPGIMPGMMNMK